jgi:hypothetical protein
MTAAKGIAARKRSWIKGRPSAARSAGNGSARARLASTSAGSKAGRRPASPFATAQSGPELIEMLGKRVRESAGRGWAAATGRKRARASGRRPAGVTGRKRAASTLHRRPHRRAAGKTRAQLYEVARKRGLPGRSKMRKDELARKLRMR